MDSQAFVSSSTCYLSPTPSLDYPECGTPRRKRRHDAIATTANSETGGLGVPLMFLSGHQGEVFSAKFSPCGRHVASGGLDRAIFIWRVFQSSSSWTVLEPHQGALTEVQWASQGDKIYAACTDGTLSIWDIDAATCIQTCQGHQSFVNSCARSVIPPDLLVSASSDGTARLWDPRHSECVACFEHECALMAVEIARDGSTCFTSGMDGTIRGWDIRNMQSIFAVSGNKKTVTGIRLSGDGRSLATHSTDGTVRAWNVKPFAPLGRLMRTFEVSPNFMVKNLVRPCWSYNDRSIICGSGDHTMVGWDVLTSALRFKVPSHNSQVTEVDFHPSTAIMLTSGSEGHIFMGRLDGLS